MNTESPQVHRVERVDDVPVLLATLVRLKVAETLDSHFPSGHRWKGELTFGDVVCVWLAYITSQGDHRLCSVQDWAAANLHTLQACLGKVVRPLDCHDDRLANILDHLASDGPWQDFEADLNRHTVRVYNLNTDLFRVDTTTASSYVEVLSQLGLFQFGHSKGRSDLPQIKVPMATLDPLGMPVTAFVVPGNCADDPLYVPEIKKVQQAFGTGGKTYVGDCKMAALATRAYVASTGDYYLCPLSEAQLPREELLGLLQPYWQGQQGLVRVYRPAEDDAEQELVAEGFCLDVPLQCDVDGKVVRWTERRWLVRSLAYAGGQHEQLGRRLQAATEQLEGLNQRKQGKKRLSAEEMAKAAEDIVKKQRVQGMLSWQVQTTTHTRKVRAYGDRPGRTDREQEHHLEVSLCQEEVERAKREMGWRGYAANQVELNLAGVVWGYRGQNRLEGNWPRLKGQPLGLEPMYLQSDRRVLGLVLLLSLGLRLLSLLEWVVRKKLHESGQRLKGLYPGQPGRQAHSPTAELLLKAFKGVSLAIVEVTGQSVAMLPPLTSLQQSLLALWDLPSDLYLRLSLHFPVPPPI
jgi:transposase